MSSSDRIEPVLELSPTGVGKSETPEQALSACRQALRRVCIALPHLAGLAHSIRVQAEWRVATAGIFASGRLVVNPNYVASLTLSDLSFVMAHELLHLALGTHLRGSGEEQQAVNIAHDYIINDILRTELDQEVPAGGLTWHGARDQSLESLLARRSGRRLAGRRPPPPLLGPIGEALADAGLIDAPELDVLSAEQERTWYLNDQPQEIERLSEEIRVTATKANGLRIMYQELEWARLLENDRQMNRLSTELSASLKALKSAYQPPWELLLQRWFDAQAPTGRSFARASRRGVQRSDIVLPGRKREGWTLHIVLDTSGSMSNDLRAVLGIIASFCENTAVGEVHVLQCDVSVTVDQWVTPEQLQDYRIHGYGGSDMSPAMRRLAEDLEVEAAIVVTDGAIRYPSEPMPYEVLWAVIGGSRNFRPDYGQVVVIPSDLLRS